jgi:hypothetical protein
MCHTLRTFGVCALTLGTAVLSASTAAANHPAENGPPSRILIPHDPPPSHYRATLPHPNYPDNDPQAHGNMTTTEPYYPEYNYPEYGLDVPRLPTSTVC